jgi:hypothetical protein
MEILKTLATSWPFFIFLLGVAALLVLRKPLTEIFPRLRKSAIGKWEISLDPTAVVKANQDATAPETGLVKPGSDPITADRLQALKDFDLDFVTAEQEKHIRVDLGNVNLEPQQQVEILVKHLATTQLMFRWEHTYRIIFGSQLLLLKHLNLFGTEEKTVVSTFYEGARTSNSLAYANISFDQWLHFLISYALVTTEDDVHYAITFAGKSFLKWMVDASVIDVKPY